MAEKAPEACPVQALAEGAAEIMAHARSVAARRGGSAEEYIIAAERLVRLTYGLSSS